MKRFLYAGNGKKTFICLNKYNYERDNDEKYLLKSRIREKLFIKKKKRYVNYNCASILTSRKIFFPISFTFLFSSNDFCFKNKRNHTILKPVNFT